MTVFRIKCKKVKRNYKNLWEAKKVMWSVGTAFAMKIGDNCLLLTAYHIIEDAIEIGVIPDKSRTSYTGKCILHSYEIDLAIIEIVGYDHELINPFHSSNQSCEYLLKNELKQGSMISVLGFPNNELSSSLTTGVVSRICFKKVNDHLPHIVAQIDASISLGNSGGPVFTDDKIVCGMVLGGLLENGNSNISFILPIFTIERYLREYRYMFSSEIKNLPECCDLGIVTKPTQVIVSRNSMECPEIISVGYNGPSDVKLFKKDVIISINGYDISQYDLLTNGLPYWQIVREKYPHDTVTLKVLRNNETVTVILCLDSIVKPLLPIKGSDIDVHYYMFAGLDFMALNMHYFYPLSDNIISDNIINLYHKYKDEFAHGNSQVVILKSIIPSEITSKYKYYNNENLVLTHINNKRIRNMRSVFSACENISENNEMIQFKFSNPNNKTEETIELDHKLALERSNHISNSFMDRKYHNY